MKFHVIGIDDSRHPHLSPKVQAIVQSAKVFSGGVRHHEIMHQYLPQGYQWINIVVPLEKVFEQYDAHSQVVVFASGDPLFFGFANTILRMRPQAEVQVYPFFNSLQLLAHRLLLPYQDMHIVSLTGRPWPKFDEAMIEGKEMIGVLTDNKLHTPASIAQRMLDYGYDNYRMHIGELLGNDECERTSTWDIAEVVDKEFQFPNNLILERIRKRPRPLGIPEGEFHLLNGRTKMITKMPIRLLSLSVMDLRSKHTMWDVGFCTGSVSVEAKMQFPHLQIYAFEIRQEGHELMPANCKKFGTPGIEFFIGDFLEQDLTDIPAPEAVFIGGHGGKLVPMVEKICQKLAVGGVIVFNSVSPESRAMFLEAVERCPLTLEHDMHIKLDDFNPIDVMMARKG